MKTRNPGLVVVVEDEEELRRSLVFTLLRNGYRVSAHSNATSALEVLQKNKLSSDPAMLLITDIHMPGLNGVELVAKVRHAVPGLPILVITGNANKEIRKSLLQLGVIRILDKPFYLHELIAEIAKLGENSASALDR